MVDKSEFQFPDDYKDGEILSLGGNLRSLRLYDSRGTILAVANPAGVTIEFLEETKRLLHKRQFFNAIGTKPQLLDFVNRAETEYKVRLV